VEVYIKSNKMNIHLVPPHIHCINAAKRAIATFKEHFIVRLVTDNRNCPLQLQDKFLHQVKLTLNLLHFSRHDPSKSANEKVNGFKTSTKHQSSQLEQKASSMTIPPSPPAGRCTELMNFMSALSPSTIGVCVCSCQPPVAAALQTHGNFTQAIA
jgi:hypothetical protein